VETIYLLLGSNLGDSFNCLKLAVEEIAKFGEIQSTSSIYKTKPWGKKDQPDFLNQAVELKASLSPYELLKKLQEIEVKLGRDRIEKWGPRIIDIDIIFYGSERIETSNLIAPHPKMHERRFALTPMAEIAGEFIHPVFKKSLIELLQQCPDPLQVAKYQA
jgi:2-amino-4-hydroxy-6-hydroxymethyldihydropteridine diphosphokinase